MKSKSIAALVLLTLIGLGFLLFGLVAVVCGFVLNFLDDFDAATGGKELEATVLSQCDYAQYWLGFPLLISAVLTIFSAQFQNRRSLTIITVLLFHACIILSMFAMILEGVDWITWKNMANLKRKWEDKPGYTCKDSGHACTCVDSVHNTTMNISELASCSNITSLSGLFGAIATSAIMGVFLSLAGIVVIFKTMSWRPRQHAVEYNLREVDHVRNASYKNRGYANGVTPPRMAGNATPIKEITMY